MPRYMPRLAVHGNRLVHEHSITATTVFARRVFFTTLVLITIAALFALAAYALSAGGLTFTDGVLLLLYALTMPWAVIGFWNGIIGFVVMRCARDPVAAVNPAGSGAERRADHGVDGAHHLRAQRTPHRVIATLRR